MTAEAKMGSNLARVIRNHDATVASHLSPLRPSRVPSCGADAEAGTVTRGGGGRARCMDGKSMLDKNGDQKKLLSD